MLIGLRKSGQISLRSDFSAHAPGPAPMPGTTPAPAAGTPAGPDFLQGLAAGALGGAAGIAAAGRPAKQDPFAQELAGGRVGEGTLTPEPTGTGQAGHGLTEAEKLEACLENMKAKHAPYEAIRSVEQALGKLQNPPDAQAPAPDTEPPELDDGEADALKLYKEILELEKMKAGMQYSGIPTDGIDRYIEEVNGQFSALPPEKQKQAKQDLRIETSPYTKMRKEKLGLEKMRAEMERYGIPTSDIDRYLEEVGRQFKDMRQYYALGDKRWAKIPYKKEGSPYPGSNYSVAGCGPASMAMIISSYLQDESIIPPVAGKWAIKKDHRKVVTLDDGTLGWGDGTGEEFISTYAEACGFRAVKVKNEAQLVEYLKQGYMAVVHMPDHYAVIESYIGRMPDAQKVYRYNDDDEVIPDGT